MAKKILGLKVTHDSAVAMIEGDELKFCTEFEKVNNGRRYTKLESLDLLSNVLMEES